MKLSDAHRMASLISNLNNTLKLGRNIHSQYKESEVARGEGVKEFRRISGIRPDYVDFERRTIYVLKPFNPKAIQQGEKQLLKYEASFEEKCPGTEWKTV